MEELTVNEIMTRGPITCNPGTPLDEVARILSDADISAIVVVDHTGVLKGVISQFDLLDYFGKSLHEITADKLMTKPPAHVQPSDTVEYAAKAMKEKHIHRLVVTNADQTKAEGVISVSDIVREMRRIAPLEK